MAAMPATAASAVTPSSTMVGAWSPMLGSSSASRAAKPAAELDSVNRLRWGYV
jgi:hypothetical protein